MPPIGPVPALGQTELLEQPEIERRLLMLETVRQERMLQIDPTRARAPKRAPMRERAQRPTAHRREVQVVVQPAPLETVLPQRTLQIEPARARAPERAPMRVPAQRPTARLREVQEAVLQRAEVLAPVRPVRGPPEPVGQALLAARSAAVTRQRREVRARAGRPAAVGAVAVEAPPAAEVGDAVDKMHLQKKDDMNGRGFKRGNLLNAAVIFFAMITVVASFAARTSDPMGKAFATPQAAVSALSQAVNSNDASKLREVFGPGIQDLKNPDRVQATNELEAFAADLNTSNALVRRSETNFELDVGPDAYPFPVPIVQKGGQWYFDTGDGAQELLNRRVGRNELDVLQTLRAYVEAQREYASKDRMGDQVLQYAQRIASTPGKKDGLYWSPDVEGEESPLGPLVADAQGGGYKMQSRGQSTSRAPFHGYYFKILTQQGKDSPGGKYNYIINGRMIAGFAMIAWPAEYGNTGVMTFIVNQQGRVYQRDLGPKTGQAAPSITKYNPGAGWELSPD